jgi:hypothetical protein
VYAGESLPWRVWQDSDILIKVTDSAGQPIAGAIAEVISVHNKGQTAVSDQYGAFLHIVVDGPITVQVKKAGYVDWVGSWLLGNDEIPAARLARQ